MYDSEKSTLACPQPLVALPTAALICVSSRNDGKHEPNGPEMPPSSSIETLTDKSDHSPVSNDRSPLQIPEFRPTPTLPAALLAAQGSSSTDLKQCDNRSCKVETEAEGDIEDKVETEAEGDIEDEGKREREHKKRSKNWTRPETLKLIKMRTDFDARFAKSGRKAELWEKIAEALQKDNFSRDGQQCKDKWEKLTSGYKEVRDGFRDKEENPFYEEMHCLLSGKSQRTEMERDDTTVKEKRERHLRSNVIKDCGSKQAHHVAPLSAAKANSTVHKEGKPSPEKKRKRGPDDVSAVQNLLETLINRQQRFFREMFDAMEKKEQLRERIRQEKEEKWRAEERAQRSVLNNAMIVLTQRLVGEKPGSTPAPAAAPVIILPTEGHQGPKKRSKNWKRTEVLQLIKSREEMESTFAKSTKRVALWEELAEKLATQGVRRDGKQCREKWDKLMAEYKDVTDGRREQGESLYFAELTAFLGRPLEAENLKAEIKGESCTI